MTKNELNNLMIGDKVRKKNNNNILTVVKIKVVSTHNEEYTEIYGESSNGRIIKGEYKKFVIPKKFVRFDRHNWKTTRVSLEEILSEDGLYSYSMTGTVEEALYNGEEVYSPNAIFKWQ